MDDLTNAILAAIDEKVGKSTSLYTAVQLVVADLGKNAAALEARGIKLKTYPMGEYTSIQLARGQNVNDRNIKISLDPSNGSLVIELTKWRGTAHTGYRESLARRTFTEKEPAIEFLTTLVAATPTLSK